MNTKLDQIEAFVAIAQLGHFAAAANALKLTPAAISKKLSELEKTLSVKLIHRTTRSCKLTEVGERYYERWLNILDSINETDAFIKDLHEIPKGELSVLTPRRELILPYLQEFQQRYPKITLNIEIAERIPDFTKEKVDVSLGVSYEVSDNIVRKKLSSTRYALVASPAYLKKMGMPLEQNDLTKYHYIEHSKRMEPGWIPFDRDQRIYCRPTLLLNDTTAMMQCALADLGITRLHYSIVEKEIKEKNLISIFENDLKTEIPIYIYYAYSRYIDPKIRSFIDFIVPHL